MPKVKKKFRVASHRKRYYRKIEPLICFNAVNPKNGTYGYFICPESGQPDSYDYCCGEVGDQRCCRFFDDGGRVAGVVIGVLAFCAMVGVGIFCLFKHCRGRKSSSGGKKIDDNKQTTWNRNETLENFQQNDSIETNATSLNASAQAEMSLPCPPNVRHHGNEQSETCTGPEQNGDVQLQSAVSDKMNASYGPLFGGKASVQDGV